MGLWLSPVVERELRVALHQRDSRNARFQVARVGVLVVSLFMLFGAWTGRASWGRTLHLYLVLGGLALAVGPAIRMSVGLFAEERRQQTLELLHLAGMGCGELFAGKLLGGALAGACELMALAPLLAVPFLSGGLSFDLFLATVACLPTVFVFALAAGSLASAMCRQEGTAAVVAAVLLGASWLALPLPYNLGSWLTGAAPFGRSWLVLSPALGPWMAAKNFGGFRVGDFWTWTAAMWAWSAVGLGLAAVILRRNWRRDMERLDQEGWRGKWEALALGNTRWREALRRRVLSINAYQWLAQQDRRPVLQAWGFMGAVSVFWLLCCCAWPRVWPTTVNFYSTAIVLLVGTDALMSHAAARRMAADRRDGALELLLTTPLSPDEMLAGQRAALREQFAPVKWVLFGLLVVMALAGLSTRAWGVQALISYLAAWCLFFAWCWQPAHRFAPLAMWVAANCGRPIYGTFHTGGAWNRVWFFYWIWTMSNSVGVFTGKAVSFPTGSTFEMWVVIGVVLWALIFMAAKARQTNSMVEPLVSQLRSIAQDPLPNRDDPRFKEWKDIRTRFPAPPSGGLPAANPVKAAGAWFWRPLGRVCGWAWVRLRGPAANRSARRKGDS